VTQEIDTLFDAAARLADQLNEQKAAAKSLVYNYIPKEHWAEYDEAVQVTNEKIEEFILDLASVKNVLKEAIIETGESHKRNGIKAVYVQGRTSWDTKKLTQAMRMHPWLDEYRTIGKPYVQIKGL
jgi:hypothetical protein